MNPDTLLRCRQVLHFQMRRLPLSLSTLLSAANLRQDWHVFAAGLLSTLLS